VRHNKPHGGSTHDDQDEEDRQEVDREEDPCRQARRGEDAGEDRRAREEAGKTNADVLAVLRERFGLPEKHNFYPVWYRAYAVKHGVVTREFAKAHAGPPVARKPATA